MISLLGILVVAHGQHLQVNFDAAGNLFSQTAEIGGPPQILRQPQLQVIVPGELASFFVIAADARGLGYQWRFNGANLAGANQDTLFLQNVGVTNEGQYSVVLLNTSGSVTSAPAALVVDSRECGMPDSWQLAHFGNLTNSATGDFDGDGVSNLQEFLDGTDPANSNSVHFALTVLSDGGSVVIVPGGFRYTNGTAVTLTATPLSSDTFHAWTGDANTRGGTITLTMTNNKTVFAHFSPITFQWTNDVGRDWNVASNWTPNLAPGSNDSVVIAMGVTVTLNSEADLAGVTLGSGNIGPILTGNGALTIRGAGAWAAGTMSGAGRTVIAPGASFTFANANSIFLSRTLENGGTALWSGGGAISMNGGVITNEAGALFQILSPHVINYGGGAPRFDNAGILRIAGAGTASFGVSLNNYNLVDIQGGTLSMSGGNNAGTITVPAGTTVDFAGGVFTSSASSIISGAGTFMVDFGSGTLAGTVNVTGSNVFSNASIDFTGNYICTNNTMVISGGTASFDGTGVVSPAVLNLNGTLGGAETVTVTSAMSWTGGAMTGTGRTVIPPGVTLTVANPSSIFITDRTLDSGGTTLWSAASMFMNGGVITNEAGALFQMQSPCAIYYGSGTPRFDNAGILRIAGAGTASCGVSVNNFNLVDIQGGTLSMSGGNNAGTITVPAGTTVDFAGGVFTSSASSLISGAGTFRVDFGSETFAGTINVCGSNVFNNGSVHFTGNYICTNNTMVISGGTASFDGTGVVSPAVLNLNGTLSGAETVTVRSAMSWTGGAMTGTGRTVIPPGATLTVPNPTFISLTDRTLDNGGTTFWSAPSMAINGGVITNRAAALFQIQSPSAINYGGGSPRFDNAGTFLTATTGTSTFGGVPFNNYGTVGIRGGIFSMAGGGFHAGTVTVPAGTTMDFAGGTFTSSANSSITGAGILMVSGGNSTLAGTINVTGSNVFNNGYVDFTGNYICTNNTMAISGATANFDGTGVVSPAVLNLSGTLGGSNTVTVRSAMSWTGGAMTGTGRTVIPPGATLTVPNPTFISLADRTLDNGGTTFWSAPNMSINGGVITNRAGALFQIQSPSAVNYGGGSPRFDSAGTFRITGTGTATFGGVSFTNYGKVDIQSGFLAANGGYASSSNAVLNCALAGTMPGTNYGQLQVAGSVTLNGTLSVNLANNYIPTTNDSFTILVAGTRNGAFANFIYPSNLVAMQLTNTANSVIVLVTGVASPQPLLLPPALSGSNVLLTWTAVSNTTYRLEFNPDLTPSNWNALPGDVIGVSNTASKQDTPTPSNRFYRVRVLP
jgi:hypothetical protein